MPGTPPPPPKPSLPRRPVFVSGLPEREELPRPRTVALVRWLVRLNALLFLVPTILAAMDHQRVRSRLRAELAATSAAEDYSASEIAQAVNVSLGVLLAVGLLLLVFELNAAQHLAQRNTGARLALIGLAIAHLPVAVLSSAMRVGGPEDIGMTALQLLTLVAIVVLASLPRVKRWLHARPPLAVNRLTVTPYLPPSRPPTPPPSPRD